MIIIEPNSITTVNPVSKKKTKPDQLTIAVVYAFHEGQWDSNQPLINNFKKLGHTIDVYNAYTNGQYNFDNFNSLIKKRNVYDLVLVLDIGRILDDRVHTQYYPGLVIGEMGDDPQRHKFNLYCSQQYDVLLTPQYSYTKKYGKLTYWFPHFYDESVHKKYDVSIEHDVVTAMSEYGRRQETIEKLKRDFDFRNYVGVSGKEYSRCLQKGKIIFNQSNHNELTRRIFEGMASGKMVLTDKIFSSTGLYSTFSSDIHFVQYENYDDLCDKIKYYLEHDDEREEIAKNGYEEVQKHSSMSRAKHILEIYKECLTDDSRRIKEEFNSSKKKSR